MRKNLTLTTIESESRKAEVASLNSQIAHLEGTVKVNYSSFFYHISNLKIKIYILFNNNFKSLRESMEKSNHLETNYESTAYELKKKQEDLRKLQQVKLVFFLTIKVEII